MSTNHLFVVDAPATNWLRSRPALPRPRRVPLDRGPGPLRDLPEGDKEKQMPQGLLASRERVVSEVRQRRLFEVRSRWFSC